MFSFLKGNMMVLTVTRTLGMFTRSMVFPYASLYILALGGTTANVGFVDSLRPLASLLIFPIAGFFADRGGRVKLMVIAGFLSALTYLSYVLATDWMMLAIGNLILGMIVFHFPAESALMADSLQPSERGIGFATSNAIPGGVAVIAPYIAGYIIDSLGTDPAMRYLYALLLTSYAIAAAIQMRFLKETSRVVQTKLGSSRPKTIIVESYRSVAVILRWMPKSLRALAIIIALNFAANAIAAPYWVVYGTQVIGLSATEWGLLTLISSAFRIAVSVPAGAAVDRFGRRKAIMVSFILTIPSILSFTYATGFAEVLVIFLTLQMANAFMFPASEALVADIVPREMRGRVMAAMGRGALMINPGMAGGGGPGMGYIFAIPVMFGSLSGGFIYGVNPALPWILQSTILVSILFVSLAMLHEPERAEI